MVDFNELYRRYAPDVHRFSFWLSGDPVTADDATAETFARAWTRREAIRVGTVKAYLLTIARNVVLHHFRRTRPSAELNRDLHDPAPDPERALLAREDLTRVLRALDQLREEDRAAFLLRVDHGLSYDSVARALGISLSAAKVRVHRVRLKLAMARTKETTK
ncbi:MAG: RNA polymerase sigma factor [Thermoanaerobaculia bacterium]